MRRTLARLAALALAVVAALAAGCGSNNRGKLEDTRWSSLAATVGGEVLPEGARQLVFGKDGAFAYVMYSGEEKKDELIGKYSLGMGDYVTLTMDRQLAGRKQHVQKVTVTDGNPEQLTLTDSDGTSLTFKKVPPGSGGPN